MSARPRADVHPAQRGDVYASNGRPPTEVDYWVVVGTRNNGREVLLVGHNERGDVVMVARQPFNPKREVIGQAKVATTIEWKGF